MESICRQQVVLSANDLVPVQFAVNRCSFPASFKQNLKDRQGLCFTTARTDDEVDEYSQLYHFETQSLLCISVLRIHQNCKLYFSPRRVQHQLLPIRDTSPNLHWLSLH